jgi:hypothetical protein
LRAEKEGRKFEHPALCSGGIKKDGFISPLHNMVPWLLFQQLTLIINLTSYNNNNNNNNNNDRGK